MGPDVHSLVFQWTLVNEVIVTIDYNSYTTIHRPLRYRISVRWISLLVHRVYEGFKLHGFVMNNLFYALKTILSSVIFKFRPNSTNDFIWDPYDCTFKTRTDYLMVKYLTHFFICVYNTYQFKL